MVSLLSATVALVSPPPNWWQRNGDVITSGIVYSLIALILWAIGTSIWRKMRGAKLQQETNGARVGAVEKDVLVRSLPAGIIYLMRVDQVGDFVRSGTFDYLDQQNPSVRASAIEALHELVSKRLVSHSEGQLYELTGTGFEHARRYAGTALMVELPTTSVTLVNGIVQRLRAETVEFRINEDGRLGLSRRSIRFFVDGRTVTHHISHLSQILGPTQRRFVDCCSPHAQAEQLTITVRGDGNVTGYVLDTCDLLGRKTLALTGFDPVINNTVTINLSAIARVDLP